MGELVPLNDDERDELIAYLDGELDDQAARGVESRLQRDPRVRAEVDALKRTWELLDYLPRPEPSPTFTHRTVERIAMPQPGIVRWRWRLMGLSWAAAVLISGFAGYAAMTRFYPREPPIEEMAPDLRVIENKRYYEAVDDIDFLRDL